MISFAAFDYQRKLYSPIIDRFNKDNPDVVVQFVLLDKAVNFSSELDFNSVSWRIANYADTALVPFLDGDGSSIRGLPFADLTPYLSADKTFDSDDYFPISRAYISLDKSTYFLPQLMRLSLLSYNRDLLSNSSIPTPSSDWTWSDLLQTATSIARRQGNGQDTYGFLDTTFGTSTVLGLLSEKGLDLLSRQPDTIQLDDPRTVEVFEQVIQATKTNAIYAGEFKNASDINSAVGLQGLVLNQHVGFWQPEVLQYGYTDKVSQFKVGTVAYPGEQSWSAVANAYVISAGTKHPQESWRWLSFINQQEGSVTQDGVPNIALAPARKSVAQANGYWKQFADDEQVAIRSSLNRPPTSSNRQPQDVSLALINALSEALQTSISNGTSPAIALSAAQDKFQQETLAILQAPTPAPRALPVVATPPAIAAQTKDVQLTFLVTDGPPQTLAQIRSLAEKFNAEHGDIGVNVVAPGVSASNFEQASTQSDCFLRSYLNIML